MQIRSLRIRTTAAVVLCLLLLESLTQPSFATIYDFVQNGTGATLVKLSTSGSGTDFNILGLTFTAKGFDWARIVSSQGTLLDHYDVGPWPGTFHDSNFGGVYLDGAGGLMGPFPDFVTIFSSPLRNFLPPRPQFELGFTDSYNGDSLRLASHSDPFSSFFDVVANGDWREVPPVYWTGAVSSAWNGGVLNGQSNWTSDSAGTSFRLGDPGPECDVYFSSANLPPGTRDTTLGKDFTIKSLTISGPSNVTINSQAGTSQTLTIAGGSGIDIQSGAGTVSIGANVAFSSGTNTITVNNSDAAYITGAISGTDGLNLVSTNGQGYLLLTGTNNYTGGTTISSGLYVQVGVYGATGSLSSGPVVNNGNLLIARNNTYKIFSGISGTGTLYQNGDGTTTLSGTNTYTGGTFVNAGRLLVNGTVTGVVQVNSGGTLGGTGLISGAVTRQFRRRSRTRRECRFSLCRIARTESWINSGFRAGSAWLARHQQRLDQCHGERRLDNQRRFGRIDQRGRAGRRHLYAY